MKKIIAIILALAMCLAFCACGSGAAVEATEAKMDKNDTSHYTGTWENEYFRLTITKGGVGRYENLMNGTEYYDLNWEVKDEVLITQISFFGMEHKAVLELNEDGTALNVIQVGFPAYVEGETVFTKQ